MYALAINSLDIFFIFLDMQYSPYKRLKDENAVSTAHHFYSILSLQDF